MVGVPITSAAKRAATSFWIASCVGTSTLPPMWPHFLTDASWSSKCTPAAPARIIAFISSNALSTPPKPGLGVGDDRREEVDVFLVARVHATRALDLVGALERRVDALHDLRHRVDRVQRLVGVHRHVAVVVGGDLPARQVDRLDAGLDLLHRLARGERAEAVDVRLGGHQLPQLLGAEARERVVDLHVAAQPDDVLGLVGPLDALPARVVVPVLAQCGCSLVGHFSFLV